MFKIDKNEPIFFKKAKSKVKKTRISSAWSSSEIETIRPKLREYILLEEQNLLCAYCEREIDDNPKNSNIDHFRLKAGHLFPEKTLDYNNLLVSCNTKGRCSNYKDKHIKSKDEYNNIVNPITENPDDFFDYLLTGRIVAIDKNPKSEFTIDIFQLGREREESLSRQRKDIADSLEHIKNLSLDEVYEIFGNEFYSFIKIIYSKLNQKG
jgi:uncharacterized protein (TIGR02646 family)